MQRISKFFTIPAPLIVSIIILLASISMLRVVPTGTLAYMRQVGFPLNEYGVFLALTGGIIVAARKTLYVVFAPLSLVPFVMYVYIYSKSQEITYNGTLVSVCLFVGLLIFMIRSLARYYLGVTDPFDQPHPASEQSWLARAVEELGDMSARQIGSIWMIILGVLLFGHPETPIVAFIETHGLGIEIYGVILIVAGWLRLWLKNGLWDILFTLPFVMYLVFVIWYIIGSPESATGNLAGAAFYVGLYIFVLRANADVKQSR